MKGFDACSQFCYLTATALKLDWLRSKCVYCCQHIDLRSWMQALSWKIFTVDLWRFCVLSLHREVGGVGQYAAKRAMYSAKGTVVGPLSKTLLIDKQNIHFQILCHCYLLALAEIHHCHIAMVSRRVRLNPDSVLDQKYIQRTSSFSLREIWIVKFWNLSSN